MGLSYDAVVGRAQYWRVISSCFSHTDVLHIAFNMTSLWALGPAEAPSSGIGPISFLTTTFLLCFLPQILQLLAFHVYITRAGPSAEGLRHVNCIGYSAVLFGWEAVLSLRAPSFVLSLGGLDGPGLPVSFAPFASLLLVQLLVPNASMSGHLAGIVVGYAIGYGAFDWLTPYWACVTAFWLVVVVVWSLKPPCLRVVAEALPGFGSGDAHGHFLGGLPLPLTLSRGDLPLAGAAAAGAASRSRGPPPVPFPLV